MENVFGKEVQNCHPTDSLPKKRGYFPPIRAEYIKNILGGVFTYKILPLEHNPHVHHDMSSIRSSPTESSPTKLAYQSPSKQSEESVFKLRQPLPPRLTCPAVASSDRVGLNIYPSSRQSNSLWLKIPLELLSIFDLQVNTNHALSHKSVR